MSRVVPFDWQALKAGAEGQPHDEVLRLHRPFHTAEGQHESGDCWCSPLVLTCGQVAAMHPVELQAICDRIGELDA